jgi:uncharacterized circularly permuted ATP-grasp superfamily protein/uncharacterized alpha-E superfamily protein
LNLILADIYGPQALIKEQLLPPYLVFNHPGFLRPLRYVEQRTAPLHTYAADLARMPSGAWRVLADRTQAPAGIGYALRHRSIAARIFPEAFRSAALQPLQPTIDLWRDSLQAIGAALDDDPTVVLLTPGPHNPTYPEHVLLAHELGVTLVRGADLAARDGKVWLKTLSGLVRVHVILRRLDGEYCDPLELRSDSALGCSGIVAAARAGHVAIVNLPGSAVIETPAYAPFLPALARRLLGEELALPAVTTWWCGQEAPLKEVLGSLDKFVLQPTFDPNPTPIEPFKLSAAARQSLIAQIKAAPESFVAVAHVDHGLAPTFGEQGLEPRPVVLRATAVYSNGAWVPMPGGVARVAIGKDAQRAALGHGGTVKDVWILREDAEAVTGAAQEVIQLHSVRRVPDAVSSRVVDDLFWLGRYMERLDAGARELRATVTRLTRGLLGGRDLAELSLLAALLARGGWIADSDARARVDSRTFAEAIAGTLGPEGAIAGYQSAARDLCMSLRDRLSQDMWRLVNGFTMSRRRPVGARFLDDLLNHLDRTVADVALFNGLVAENMTRGMGWRFLEIGRRIERGTSICTMIDSLFGGVPLRVELSVRLALELSDSIITHRRRFPMESYTISGLEVILSDHDNPRALAFQIAALQTEFAALVGPNPLTAEKELLGRLVADWADANGGSHERLTSLAADLRGTSEALAELSDSVTRSYFSHTSTPVTVGMATPQAAAS